MLCLACQLLFLAGYYFTISIRNRGRDPFNQNSDRSDREKRTTSKGGPVFSKLFRLDRTDPLSFGPKFPEILVEWIAPRIPCQWDARTREGVTQTSLFGVQQRK